MSELYRTKLVIGGLPPHPPTAPHKQLPLGTSAARNRAIKPSHPLDAKPNGTN